MKPSSVGEVVRRFAECKAEAERPHDDAEVYDAAASIGRLDYLPDRQMQLPTTARVDRTERQQGVKDA